MLKDDCTDDELASLSTFISYLKTKWFRLKNGRDLKGPVDKAGLIARKYEQYKSREAGHLLSRL